MTPSLGALDLGGNELEDLSPSFINTVISLPDLEVLALSDNPLHWSTSCPINRLLSQLSDAASSSSRILTDLRLENVDMSADCCGPALAKMLAVGSKDLQTVELFSNPSLSPSGKALVQSIANHNFHILFCFMDGLDGVLDGGDEFYDNEDSQILKLALDRNRRLEETTHEAACGILNVARTVFFWFPAPSSSSTEPVEFSTCFRLMDLPTELLHVVMLFVYPGALSDRQLVSVVQHATDRSTLVHNPRLWKYGFLKEMGCTSYDV